MSRNGSEPCVGKYLLDLLSAFAVKSREFDSVIAELLDFCYSALKICFKLVSDTVELKCYR